MLGISWTVLKALYALLKALYAPPWNARRDAQYKGPWAVHVLRMIRQERCTLRGFDWGRAIEL